MADESPCDEGEQQNQFCGVRPTPSDPKCPCGNNYRDSQYWATTNTWERAPYKIKKGADAGKRSDVGGNSHHTVPICSTSIVIAEVSIKPVRENTKWCVNDRHNMLALPKWPLTINWYFCFSDPNNPFAWAPTTIEPPPFQGLAQHDYDHGRYDEEAKKGVRRIISNVQMAMKPPHEKPKPSQTLASGLNSLRQRFKEDLQGRSTHQAWISAMHGTNRFWWAAFSMVGQSGSRRAFPGKNDPNFKVTFDNIIHALQP